MTPCHTMIVTWSIVLLASSSGWAQSLVGAVLPPSRSVQVGGSATAVATVINAGQHIATGCMISPPAGIPAIFSYVFFESGWWDVPVPVDIAPGAALRLAFGLTPLAPVAPTEVTLNFKCANTEPVPIFPGVNTLLFSASATPVADVVALAATPNNNGIVDLTWTGAGSAGVFAVATVNMGTEDVLTVSADSGDAELPVSIAVCQTEPQTSTCLLSPEQSVTTPIPAGATPTFGVFVMAPNVTDIPLIPQTNRVFVRFKGKNGVTRGLTSVAVWTSSVGYWDYY
jgi:hypothetical protein